MLDLNKYFDHTLLKADAREEDIKTLCKEAAENSFFAVCVNSSYVPLAVSLLEGTNVKIAAVVGFPLGAGCTPSKAYETSCACIAGAHEIDMVIHIGALKEKRYDYVESDISAVVLSAKEHGAIVKVILETCLLTDDEIIKACELSINAGAAFVKTSTGFSTGGATYEHVELMKKTVGKHMEVKASGGIKDLDKTLAMIEAGADRIGSSSSVFILNEYKSSVKK